MNTEWMEIAEWIASFAPSRVTGNKIKNLKPLSECKAQQRFSQLDEIKSLSASQTIPPRFETDDVSDIIDRFNSNEPLSPKDYRTLGEFLRLVRQTVSAVRYAEFPKALIEDLQSFSPPVSLEQDILKVVTVKGEISEDASDELKHIRKKMRETHGFAEKSIKAMITNPEYGGLLQEEYFTIRDDRYVLPFKSAFKRVVKGVVHNYSRTGKTAFLEPLTLMDTNNKLTLLAADERAETAKILAELRGALFRSQAEVLSSLSVAQLFEMLITIQKWQETFACVVPVFNHQTVDLIEAWYPPVLISRGNELVKNDFHLSAEKRIMVISGPNAGGKSIALKVINTIAELAVRGLPVTASSATMPFFTDIRLIVGDLQNAGEGESSFSAHLRELSAVVQNTSSKELVLIDEIGSGTDPMQGGAFSRAFLEYLQSKNIWAVVTSHLAEVKSIALEHQGFVPVAMGYDDEHNTPTYRFLYDLVGGSNALRLVKKIGFPDAVIARLEELLSSGEHSAEALINRLRQKETELLQREKELQQQLEEAKVAKQEALQLKERYAKRERDFEEKRLKALDKLLQLEEEELRKRLNRITPSRISEQIRQVRREREQIKKKTETYAIENDEKPGIPLSSARNSVVSGKSVLYDRLLKMEGIFDSFSGKNAVVRIKGKLLTVPTDRLILLEKTHKKTVSHSTTTSSSRQEYTIDIRGTRVDDALTRIEREIDKGFTGHIHSIRLIHGHGSGVLKERIRLRLTELAPQYGFRFASEAEEGGDDGVTLIIFV